MLCGIMFPIKGMDAAQNFVCDSLPTHTDTGSVARADSTASRNWFHLLKKGKLDLKDTTVVYPRFIKFCVDLYNWGDRTFNSYDSDYVQGTGHKWKVMLKSDNWSDSYAMHFEHKMPIWMLSEIYANAGIYVSYMALSVGYSLDMSNIIGNRPSMHKKWEFSFTCARFNIDAYYSDNTGGSVIRRFGDYNNGHIINEQFPGMEFRSYGVDLYYFLNNRRYSQGAVYNFSKIQRRSAGSWIFGITYSNQRVDADFTRLPEELVPYYISDRKKYRFHYDDYCFLIGYGHNFVAGKHFTFNISALPSVGYKRTHEDCVNGKSFLFSMNYKGKIGMIYNVGDIFLGLSAKVDGHWFLNSQYSFFNSIINATATAGVRF